MNETLWTWESLSIVKPEIFLAVSGLLLLVFGACLKGNPARSIGGLVMIAMAIAAYMIWGMKWDSQVEFSGQFIFDPFSAYMKILVLFGLIGSVALSLRYMAQENMARFEYPVLVLFAGLGMMVMLSANSFLSLYVGLELQSLSLYVLAAIRRDHAKSSEAGMKYFVLGSMASGILLFGISLVYGYTGALGFDTVAKTLAAAPATPGAVIGLVFVLVGIAFKVSAVPFHMWTPDVYEGAPTSVTALFAIVPKVAAIGLLMRLIYGPFASMVPDWQQILWFLSAASMAWGAFAALNQNNIKRLMAYSSIGNIGFAMVGLVAGTAAGAGASILYMTIYMAMTAGTFGLIMMLRRNGVAVEKISDMAGLSKTNPVICYCMAIMMFSMSGIPPLAGFFSKMVVFQEAMSAHFYVLSVFGVLTSVVSAYYYLRIIKTMFFDESIAVLDREPGMGKKIVAGVCVAFVVLFVLSPDPLLKSSKAAAGSLFPVAENTKE
ncbi:MAG: NADH-quinone oxidoreductase subunit [Micavibrio sp.]|nr:NADH-quinone oxidoreductase subunit [Micavibrio sp.]